MQKIIFEKPYKFVPPHRGDWWPTFIRDSGFLARRLRKADGVESAEVRNVERLRESLDAGHGIMVTPNHSRPSDPLVLGTLTKEANRLLYAMASWHLFNQTKFMSWAINKMGAFSIFREGDDRQALTTAIDALVEAKRFLVIFPEGATTRTNDRLATLLPGVTTIARLAARKRAKQGEGKKVVIHPLAIKYFYKGDILEAIEPVLTELETRLAWTPSSATGLTVLDRIRRIGEGLLSLKEIEYFGAARNGIRWQRQLDLIERLIDPLEEKYLGEAKDGGIVARVKALRVKMMPELIAGTLPENERKERWRELEDIYLSQQVYCYPQDYLTERPSIDRILETLERFEEDLNDKSRVHGKLHCVMEVGEAIEVDHKRDKNAETDPILDQIAEALSSMLAKLSLESPTLEEALAARKQ